MKIVNIFFNTLLKKNNKKMVSFSLENYVHKIPCQQNI